MGDAPATEAAELHSDLRALLELVAGALSLDVGQTELRARFQDGDLRWFGTERIRVPASELAPGQAAER